MESEFREFAKSAKAFTRSPLGIIGLFVVFVYGFASLILIYGKNLVSGTCILIYFLVSFPVIVFVGFLWLVAKHHNKLYGPSDFKNEENFLKMQMSTTRDLSIATVKRSDSTKNVTRLQERLEEIFRLVSKIMSKKKRFSSEDRILWVDDNHDNNIYERKAFRSSGIMCDIGASNTEEALDLLNKNEYVAIISDMERKEGSAEGYVLLESVRKMGIKIPFFIYTHASSLEAWRATIKKGGQGITDMPGKLYEMVMDKIYGS
jgi:CheY-like chemotaxis protein